MTMINLADVVYHDKLGDSLWIVEETITNLTPFYETLKIRELVRGEWDKVRSRQLLICRHGFVKDHLRLDDIKVKGNLHTDNPNTMFHVKHTKH